MTISPIPNPSAPAVAAPSYAGVPANLTAPNPYATPSTTGSQLNFGSEIGQQILGGPAKSKYYTTTNTTQAPYAPTIGPINQLLTGTAQLYGGGAPQISPAEQAGYNALTAAGTGPSQNYLTTAANSGANIAGGSLMNINSNPYLQQIIGETGSQALQDVNKTFGGAGRTGSGLNEWFGAQGTAMAENSLLSNEYGSNLTATVNSILGAPNNVTGSLAYPTAQIAAGTAQTMRPFELNQNYANILDMIAKLGGSTSTQTQGEATSMAENGGIIGMIMNNLRNGSQAAGQMAMAGG